MPRNRRPDIDDDSFCSLRLLKIFIYFFNFLFYIAALVLIALGVWTILYKWDYVALLSGHSYRTLAYLSIAVGALLILVATFGCIANVQGRPMLVLTYTLLSLVVLVAESTLCIWSYSYYEQVDHQLSASLHTHIIRDHSIDTEVTTALKTLHEEGHCCGSSTFEDWRNSIWWQNVNTAALSDIRGFDLTVPDFCCRSPTKDCGHRDHPSNIYYDGCLVFLTTFVREHMVIISGTTFAIAVIQLIGTIFATCLFVKLRDFSRPKPVSSPSSREYSYH